jgi:hypothetical protein
MSIEVTGPDGAIHEFPDDTSTDVIKRAMAKHYGSQAARQADPYAAFSSPVPQAANPMMPWEEYASAQRGPWEDYAPPSSPQISPANRDE